MIYLYATLIAFAAVYTLWLFFLAVMNLKRVSDAGNLSGKAKVLGMPIILFGFCLDVFLNLTVFTVLLLELPQEKTISSRLQRHNHESTGWRKAVAAWFEPLLDPFDPSGDHI